MIFLNSKKIQKITFQLVSLKMVLLNILIQKLRKKAMFGPFIRSPFKNIHFSPLMAREKPYGGIRVIVDLSWPLGASVYSCIPSDIYDDIPFKLKYPTRDLVVERIKEIGLSAKLFKVNLESAFRNLRVDPYDYPFMGLQSYNLYVKVMSG